MDAFGTVRGRMGLAYQNVLAYVTGGFAFGHFNSNVQLCTVSCEESTDNLRATDNGWLPGVAAGAGIDVMVTNNMSVRGEFLALLFKDSNQLYLPSGNCGPGPNCGINFTYSALIARLGANWKF